MDGGRINQEEGEGSTRHNGANQSMEATMVRMLEYIERQESRRDRMEQGEPRREAPIAGDDVALERFLKFHPPRFAGGVDEEIAEKWMEAMSDIYATLRYEDERKVQFAAFQLEGPAKAWWRVLEQKWEQTGVPRTWNAFLNEFRMKFIPLIVQEKREEEFLNLKQRALTVTQYEAAFTHLSKYAPEMVNTEAKRKKRFMQGLHVEIQNALIPARMETYADVVEYAQRVEDGQTRLRDIRNRHTASRNWTAARGEIPQGQGIAPPRGSGGIKRPATERTGPPEKRMTCNFCGKPNHTEANCWRKAGRCFKCGSLDHQARHCFQQNTGRASGAVEPETRESVGKAKVPARVYAMDANIAEGTFASGQIAKIVIDPRIPHSYV